MSLVARADNQDAELHEKLGELRLARARVGQMRDELNRCGFCTAFLSATYANKRSWINRCSIMLKYTEWLCDSAIAHTVSSKSFLEYGVMHW